MRSELESRLRVILILFVSSFGILWVRLFYLQVVQGENLRTIAEANRTSLVFERAPRGMILDRNGAVLADNRPTFVVLFTPLELKKEVLASVIQRLVGILGISEEDFKKKIGPALRHSSMVRLMDRASRHIAFALAEQKPNLPGVSVVVEMQRRYPHEHLASHVLGFLGQVSTEEKGVGYKPNAQVGKTGLEKNYDHLLRGEDGGMRLEVDASGRSLKVLDRKEPYMGYEVRTTLDLKIQETAEQALGESGKAGAVVVLDPRNGDVLAMVSAPSFDPNLFVYTRGEEEMEFTPGSLLTDPNLPLFNRAIQGMYPPGSIFKPLDALIGLESKKIDPKEKVDCPGYFWLEGPVPRKFRCWKKEGHRAMDLETGLMNSCDVYFYQMGLKLGPDLIEGLARQFGLGAKTGIELRGENTGFIPGRGMFKTSKRRWYDGDTLNMAIGQGTILFTPLQGALLAAVTASHGKVFKPNLLKEIRYPTGELYARGKTQLVREIPLSKEAWDFVDNALREVVDKGTGLSCKIPGLAVAGKTGTAQNPHGKDHAWFMCYAPVENPTIAVSVLVEHGEKGSVTAAPIARQVLLAALKPEVKEEKKIAIPAAVPPGAGD